MERGLWGSRSQARAPLFLLTLRLIACSWNGLATGSVEMVRFAQHDNRSESALAQNEGPIRALLIETLRNFRRGGALGFSIGVKRVRRRFRAVATRHNQTLGGWFSRRSGICADHRYLRIRRAFGTALGSVGPGVRR